MMEVRHGTNKTYNFAGLGKVSSDLFCNQINFFKLKIRTRKIKVRQKIVNSR